MGGQTLEFECDSNTDLAGVYDPAVDAWRSIASMPLHLGHIGPSVFSVDHGQCTKMAASASLQSWASSTLTDHSEPGPDPFLRNVEKCARGMDSSPRVFCALLPPSCVPFVRRHPGIFVSGGVTNAPCSSTAAYRSTLMWYRPASDTWTTLMSPEGGPSQVAAYVNGSVYIQTRARLWKGRLDW